MNCRMCGRANAAGAQFCANPECGAFLEWSSDPAPDPAQRVGVRATLADAVVAVTPGSTGSTTLSVYNAGTQVEGLAIRLTGPASAWSTVEPAELSVYPEQTGTVTIRFAPPRSPSAPAGHAWYVVQLDSTVHPGLSATANGVAAVAAYHDVSAELVPASASGRGATRHQVLVDNRGNVVEQARLSAADDEGAFRMELGATAAELPPGRVGIPLTVRPPRRWFGRPRAVPIHATVAVDGATAPLRVDGTRHVVPVFPPWAPLAALATALLVGGGGAAIVLASGDGRVPPLPPATTPGPTTGRPTTAPPTTRPPATTAPPTTRPPATTRPPTDPLDAIVPADCIRYTVSGLRIVDEGASGWLLTDGSSRMLILDDQADATAALAVARRSTHQCFIGRSNPRPNRKDYLVQYWKGANGPAPTNDCLPYTPSRLRIVDEGATGWLLTDGSSRMLILDNEVDARNALTLAKAHTKHCFIGRDNTRPNRRDYIIEYWLA